VRRTLAVAATLVLWLNGTAQATPITGSLWTVSEAVAQNAIPANVPLTAPDVTLDVNAPLDFNPLHIDSQTVIEWLLSGGAFNISGSAIALNTPMEVSGSTGTIVQFLGLVTVTTGQMITVTHDDGLTLIIGATNLGFPSGPAGFPYDVSTATYTGPSGTFPFQLIYADCCGSPAYLRVEVVPEPTTLVLLGSGLVLAGLRRRFQRGR
jgi:hypothetical protein